MRHNHNELPPGEYSTASPLSRLRLRCELLAMVAARIGHRSFLLSITRHERRDVFHVGPPVARWNTHRHRLRRRFAQAAPESREDGYEHQIGEQHAEQPPRRHGRVRIATRCRKREDNQQELA